MEDFAPTEDKILLSSRIKTFLKILSSDFESIEFTTDYNRAFVLGTPHEIIIISDGDKSENIDLLEEELIPDLFPLDYIQRIYYREPDYVINLGEDFYQKMSLMGEKGSKMFKQILLSVENNLLRFWNHSFHSFFGT